MSLVPRIKRRLIKNNCLRLAQVICFFIGLNMSVTLAQPIKPFVDNLPFSAPSGYLLDKIVSDSSDMLWLSTSSNYLHRYDGVNSITHLEKNFFEPQLDAWDRLWSNIAESSEWRSGFVDLKTGKTKEVLFQDEAGSLLELRPKHYALTYNDRQMWLLTLDGQLYQTTLTSAEPKTLVFRKAGQLSVVMNRLNNNELTLDDLGNLWFAQLDRLIRIEAETGRQTDFSHYLKPGNQITVGIFAAVSKRGDTWLGYLGSNILLRIDPTEKVEQVLVDYRMMGLQNDPLREVIWIATTNGLYYITENDLKLQHYGPEPWQDAGIPSPTIRSLSLDRYNNIWLTSNDGLYVMRAMHHHVRRIIPETIRPNQPPDAGLQVILWLGKQDENEI
jgi:streptogramin lyase